MLIKSLFIYISILGCISLQSNDTQVCDAQIPTISNGILPINCEHGGIDGETGKQTTVQGLSRTGFIPAEGMQGAVIRIGNEYLYGIARFYNSKKQYLGYDKTVKDVSNIKYVRFLYYSDITDNVTIYYGDKTYSTQSDSYLPKDIESRLSSSIETSHLVNGSNIYLYDDEIWDDKGEVKKLQGWSRTPLVEINNIFDVRNKGIIIDGRAYGNKDMHIPSVVFFDKDNNIIESLSEYKVLSSGFGDKLSASTFINEGAVYVAFNTCNNYYRYLSIKGLGISGIQTVIKESSDEIKELQLTGTTSASFFHKLFTENNPDKEQTINDYISDKNKVSDEAKDLYYKLLLLKNKGFYIWGQQDDFMLVLKTVQPGSDDPVLRS